jgi:hypothetical protein
MADPDLREAEHARRAGAIGAAFYPYTLYMGLGAKMTLGLAGMRSAMCRPPAPKALPKEKAPRKLAEFGEAPPPECPAKSPSFGVGLDLEVVKLETKMNCRQIEVSAEAVEFLKVSVESDRIKRTTTIFAGVSLGNDLTGKIEEGAAFTVDAQGHLADLKVDGRIGGGELKIPVPIAGVKLLVPIEIGPKED